MQQDPMILQPSIRLSMKTLEERLIIVRKIARQLREKHHLTPPIDLERLAELEHIQIEYFHSQSGIDGYADLDYLKPVIYINEEQTYRRRKRFTLAHEIGHVRILWHTDAARCVTDDPYVYIQMQRKIDSQEYEANVFASELLIPSDWLQRQVSRIQDFSTLLNEIVTQTDASVMACLYALENVFPSGHAIYVTTDSMDYWKSFRSKGTLLCKAGCQDPFVFADNICMDKQVFSRGNYQVRYYRLLPCPTSDQISDMYNACNKDFGVLMNTLTDNHPERALHYLNHILSSLHEAVHVFLESYDGNRCVRYHTSECNIIPRTGSSDYDVLAAFWDNNGIARNEIRLAGTKRLSWVKEILYEEPPFVTTNSKILLKALVNKYFDQSEVKGILCHINGVIGNISRNGIISRAVAFTGLKARFSQDESIRPIYDDPQFNQFLSNRISEIMARRNV